MRIYHVTVEIAGFGQFSSGIDDWKHFTQESDNSSLQKCQSLHLKHAADSLE